MSMYFNRADWKVIQGSWAQPPVPGPAKSPPHVHGVAVAGKIGLWNSESWRHARPMTGAPGAPIAVVDCLPTGYRIGCRPPDDGQPRECY